MKFIKENKKKALTLIEVVISFAILFIIMVPISTMVAESMKMNKQAENKQRATVIAQKLMEKVKSLPGYNDMELEDGVDIQEDENSSSAYKITGEIEGFKVEGTIKPSEDYNSENIDTTSEIQVDGKIKVVKNGLSNNIYLDDSFVIRDPKEFIINKTSINTELIFINDISTVKKEISNIYSALEIVAENDSNLNIEIKASNYTSLTLKLYCYKFKNSTSRFDVINEKGKVAYYDNLMKQEPSNRGSTINRVYDIYIKVSKGDSYYEVKSNKAMVR